MDALFYSLAPASLVVFLLAGCAPTQLPCDQASWVDRVEDSWVVVEAPGGLELVLARTGGRRRWREGDAIFDGSVAPRCATSRREEVSALRRRLTAESHGL